MEPKFVAAWRFTFLLPTRYNPDDPVSPGGTVERAKFREIEDLLVKQFGGLSRLSLEGGPLVEGRYYSQGQVYEDVNTMYQVAVQRTGQEAFFLSLYNRAKRDFRQLDIFMTCERVSIAEGVDDV